MICLRVARGCVGNEDHARRQFRRSRGRALRLSKATVWIHESLPEDARLRRKMSLNTAKNKPVESPHIRMPVSASTPLTRRHSCGSTRSPHVEERPDENLDQMQQHCPGSDADEHPRRVPEMPRAARQPNVHPAKRARESRRVNRDAQRHQRKGDEKFREHRRGALVGQSRVERLSDVVGGRTRANCCCCSFHKIRREASRCAQQHK
jgi:hypothetical protein